MIFQPRIPLGSCSTAQRTYRSIPRSRSSVGCPVWPSRWICSYRGQQTGKCWGSCNCLQIQTSVFPTLCFAAKMYLSQLGIRKYCWSWPWLLADTDGWDSSWAGIGGGLSFVSNPQAISMPDLRLNWVSMLSGPWNSQCLAQHLTSLIQFQNSAEPSIASRVPYNTVVRPK